MIKAITKNSYPRRFTKKHKVSFFFVNLHTQRVSAYIAETTENSESRMSYLMAQKPVHFNKIRLFNGVNLELGYKPIQIYSPRELQIMEKNEIRAVELVRKIRDEHYLELQGKTIEERIAFYEEEARRFHAKIAKKVKKSKKLLSQPRPETILVS